jgi:hypothetical protein
VHFANVTVVVVTIPPKVFVPVSVRALSSPYQHLYVRALSSVERNRRSFCSISHLWHSSRLASSACESQSATATMNINVRTKHQQRSNHHHTRIKTNKTTGAPPRPRPRNPLHQSCQPRRLTRRLRPAPPLPEQNPRQPAQPLHRKSAARRRVLPPSTNHQAR